MNENTRSNLRKTKRRKLRKRAFLVLIPALLIFIGLSYSAYLYVKADTVFSNSYKDDGRLKSDLRAEGVNPNKDNVSILIVGVDASDVRNNKDHSRTDTLMLATLNKEDKSVKLVSIPRDTYAFIPEVGYKTKINHAHAYGGIKATIDTVENLMEVPVDYYVKVNFEAFIDVVDAIGGITVDVPYELYEQNSRDQKKAIHLLPGEQELNGEEALALARTRKYDSDIERGKRQQKIIKSIVRKGLSLDSVLKYDEIIEAVGKNMATNLTFDEMKSFISYGTGGNSLDFQTYSLKGYDYQPGGTYYYKLDEAALEEIKQLLKEHLEISESKTSET
ncbi:LCP family protein [Virgibacillus kekensis]|uniref:LCP family protein n=1 Tax=Virgibacillus kekensis TaxID=202261 RepID=A0ABV9DJS5_9BACI